MGQFVGQFVGQFGLSVVISSCKGQKSLSVNTWGYSSGQI